MKNVSVELTYPGRSVEQILAMFADEEFRMAVCKHQGVLDSSVTITPTEFDDGKSGMDVVLERSYGTDMVPSYAQRLVGGRVDLLQREEWYGATATVEITLPGKPGSITGGGQLVQAGDDTVQTASLNVTVGIPLLGGKIEEMMAGFIRDAFTAEHEVGMNWPIS